MAFSNDVELLVSLALREDIRDGDITSEATIPEMEQGCAYLLARERMLFCSHEFVSYLCTRFSASLRYEPLGGESSVFEADQKIGRLYGRVRELLTFERTILNFVQRLSGVSSRTAEVVESIRPAGVEVRDTRKTTPGWRELEKYAVAFGGGTNHRVGLYDAFLIKNNHIDAVGGDIALAIRKCRERNSELLCEVEVRNMDELTKALPEKPDWILLDNMSDSELRVAVEYVHAHSEKHGHRPKLEASGGLTPETAPLAARTGVDAVSMGWLTHSVPAVDISLRFESTE